MLVDYVGIESKSSYMYIDNWLYYTAETNTNIVNKLYYNLKIDK